MRFSGEYQAMPAQDLGRDFAIAGSAKTLEAAISRDVEFDAPGVL